MGARSLSTAPSSFEEEFDRDSESGSEELCINVSPFTARIEFGTTPGTKPRKHTLAPGGRLYVQNGYALPHKSASGGMVRATIEAMTDREAWPGERGQDKDGKLVWVTKPGPTLPMVVHESRADEIRARWAAALAKREAEQAAPLRMTLERADGTQVQVQADIVTPRAPEARRGVVDEEDQTAGGDDPPPAPEHDDLIEPVVILPPVDPVIPTRAEAKAARKGHQ